MRFEYNFSEDHMISLDVIDNASRTIITGEGAKSASRFMLVLNIYLGVTLTSLPFRTHSFFEEKSKKGIQTITSIPNAD